MIGRVIEACIRNKLLTLLLTLLAAGAGLYAVADTPLDAIPDLSDVQVIIFTEYPGQAPQVVEDQVTFPLSTAMLAVPFARAVRGYSFFGLSFVYVIFEDGTDMYWARSRVLEYLNYAGDRLPSGVRPRLGPDATGVGWVYEYALVDTSGRRDLAELRSIQDWYLRYELTSVPGVAEVASIGGFVKQYQVTVDPNKLVAYGIPLQQVGAAIRRSNNDVGGRLIELAETEFMVRGLGYIESLEDIRNVPVSAGLSGTPVRVRDVATVSVGPELRRGLAEWNGEGEVAGGIVVMRYGENALEVIDAVKEKLAALEAGLPEGVVVETAYDRSGLIRRAVGHLQEKLIEECLVVAAVCALFLLHFRSAFAAVFTLPVGILVSFIVMWGQGINANIMSLGGIAIAVGAMVDAGIVQIENAHRHLERDRGRKGHWEIIADASKEVGPALFYSLLIVTLSFLPVFTLEQQEGRLFKPLAYTKTYAMAAAAILSITVVPVLIGFCLRGRIVREERNPLNRFLVRGYVPVLGWLLRHKAAVLAAAAAVVFVSLFPFRSAVADRFADRPGSFAHQALQRLQRLFPLEMIGSEFMPPLYEGDLLYMPTTLPGVSVSKARELLQQTDRIIRSFPEVENVFGKVGRAETATDPAPLSMIETTITLRPQEEWRPGMTPEKLVEELDGRGPLSRPHQLLDHADQDAHRHALDRHQDPRRHQGRGGRSPNARGGRPADRAGDARDPRHRQRLRRAGRRRQLHRLRDRPRGGGPLRADGRRRAGRDPVGDGGRQRHLHRRGARALPGKPPLRARAARQPAGSPTGAGGHAVRGAGADGAARRPAHPQGAARHQERERAPQRLGLRRHPRRRRRYLCRAGAAGRRRAGRPAAGNQPGLERPVRIHGEGAAAAEHRRSGNPCHHLPAPVSQLPQRHREPDRHVHPALRPGRGDLVHLPARLQHERRRRRGVHRPRRGERASSEWSC